MLATLSPQEAYARVDFDARVEGAGPGQLVSLCYEHLVRALGAAIHAHGRADARAKSQSLTRALSALTALQMGIGGDGPVAQALHQVYEAARRALLDSAIAFDAAGVEQIRQDFADIAEALRAA